MQIFPPDYEDPLDTAALPLTDNTELNYRTRPLSGEQELRLALLILFVPVPGIVGVAALLNGLIWLDIGAEHFVLAMILLLAGVLLVHQAVGARVRRELLLFFPLSVAFIAGRLWEWIGLAHWHGLGLVCAFVTSCLIARQVAAWILVGPKVESDAMERWRVNLPVIGGSMLSLDCPELLTFGLSPLWLTLAWWLAARLASGLERLWLWPFLFAMCLHIAWFLWHGLAIFFIPWPSWQQSWRLTLRALMIFLTYDLHQTRAIGVFRFPTVWLRSMLARWTLVAGTQLALAFAVAAGWPHPMQTLQDGGSLLTQLAVNLALVAVGAPLVLITMLWFSAGTLLARFDKELTKKLPKGSTEWDIYVERIMNSNNKLEARHLLWGTSQVGDYPILVHDEIYNQHVHLLGDSGASKTSLGVAPMALQLIARGKSTVVIIDLKGDQALFEMCRREAAGCNLPFRWISNEVGHTSFVFNPFLQGHNQRLSTEQFVQELLQGLSLDHGIGYGAGYFTAMNELVLKTVLRRVRVRSFRELDRYLGNQRFYANIGGHAEDWANARELGALVSRLAASEAVNVVPGMYPNQPEVMSQAIDALEASCRPQVVYLWLRSAVDSSNAPAIARLFLWAMFNAASQLKPSKDRRVYFFMDEFQQVISDGIKLIFEQFRDLGGTLIAAHQTAGQLRRQGTDLGDTVDSCTAVKQVYRASDLNSLERLEKLSGTRLSKVAYWVQPRETGTGDLVERLDPIHADEGLVNVRQVAQPEIDRKRMLEISSARQASLIRFTFGSGYTQFAGASVPIMSQYAIDVETYDELRKLAWPTAPGAFVVSAPGLPKTGHPATSPTDPAPSRRDAEYVAEFDRRSKRARR